MANGTKGPRSIKLSPKDMEHIERVVYYEAKGEGIEGRNAVRAVILNRIASGKFGSNPLAVLNGKNQFEPVRKFGKGDARRLKVPPQVLNEYKNEHINFLKSGVDPTGGATFFLNQETAKNPYNTKSPGLKIGNHTFFNHYNDNPVTVPNYEVSLRGFKQDLTKLALTPKKPAPAPVQQTSLGKEEDLVPYQTKSEPTMWDRINPWSDYNSSPNKASDELVPYTPKNLAEGGLLDDPEAHLVNSAPSTPRNYTEDLKTAADVVTDFVPIVGEVKSGYQAVKDFGEGNYGSAALNAVGAVPFLGTVGRAGKAVKKGVEAVSDVFSPLAKSVANTPVEKAAVAAEKADGAKVAEAAADLSKALANAVPEKTVKAYKLFRTDPKRPGEFFPLFVNADKGVPKGQWLDAEVGPITSAGGVKSKIGDLAFRPGWHAGDYASATHIGGKSSAGMTKPDYRRANQVWAEVELPNDVDWQSIANSRASTVKSGPNKGQMNVKEAHITDQIPFGGHYRYKTNSNMQGNWLIGGSMKVNRELSPDEVKAIGKATGIEDLPTLPELIDQKGMSLSDLSKEAVKELKTYYPEKFAQMGGAGLASGGFLSNDDEEDPYEGDYVYTETPEVQILKYSDVLNKNSDKTFVDRILNPQKYPVPDEQTDEEGNKFYETHRMAYSEGKDGKFYVYPTVFLNEDGSYQKADDPDEAFNRAMDSGDYIEFDDEEAAKDFSINYKPDSFKNFYKENMMKKGYAHGGMAGCGMMAPDEIVGYDEVSGNPIPPGSSPENVRDDIPAMLSEGEFVVPADVVKWHGLKTFMDMRAEAKMGLMAMQMEGQLHSPMMDDEYEDQEETEEEPDSEDAVEPDVSAEEDSAEEGDEELPEGEHETPEGNVVTIVEPEIEEETMDVEEEEDEYASEYVGDQELIFIIKGDPSAFRLA